MEVEWPIISLHEAGVSLIDCEHRTPPAATSGFPYIAIPQMKAGRIDLTEARRISPDIFLQWTRKATPAPYDVVLSRRCNPGETAFIPPDLDCAIGQNLVLLRADGSSVLPEFLRWLVRGPHWWEQVSKFINVGAVFDSLKCADIPKFMLPIPSLSEQYEITHILGSLDDKNELTRRTNETLEDIARETFNSWFVDFEPVRAKMEGRQPQGMSVKTADLFPDNFVASELGLVPEGWHIVPVGSLIHIRRSIISSTATPDVWFDHYSIPAFDQEKMPIRERGESIRSFKFKVSADCVLVSRLNPRIRRVWRPIPKGDVPSICSTEFTVAIPREHMSREFLYSLFASDAFQSVLATLVTGTSGSHQRVKQASFEQIPAVVPPKELIDTYSSIVRPLFQVVDANVEESVMLSEVRDTLLPRLISGETRLKDTESWLDWPLETLEMAKK